MEDRSSEIISREEIEKMRNILILANKTYENSDEFSKIDEINFSQNLIKETLSILSIIGKERLYMLTNEVYALLNCKCSGIKSEAILTLGYKNRLNFKDFFKKAYEIWKTDKEDLCREAALSVWGEHFKNTDNKDVLIEIFERILCEKNDLFMKYLLVSEFLNVSKIKVGNDNRGSIDKLASAIMCNATLEEFDRKIPWQYILDTMQRIAPEILTDRADAVEYIHKLIEISNQFDEKAEMREILTLAKEAMIPSGKNYDRKNEFGFRLSSKVSEIIKEIGERKLYEFEEDVLQLLNSDDEMVRMAAILTLSLDSRLSSNIFREKAYEMYRCENNSMLKISLLNCWINYHRKSGNVWVMSELHRIMMDETESFANRMAACMGIFSVLNEKGENFARDRENLLGLFMIDDSKGTFSQQVIWERAINLVQKYLPKSIIIH